MADTTGPIVITNFPAHAALHVPVNSKITVTFNEQMDPVSITSNTFSVVEQNTFEPIDGTITYETATKRAIFAPTSNLKSETKYRVIITGQEDPWAVVVVGVRDTNGNYLDGHHDFTFTTGGSTSSDPDVAALPSGTTGYEPATRPNPTGVVLTSHLEVLETKPSHYETNVNVRDQIIITFNDDLGFINQNVFGTAVVGEANFSTPSGVVHSYIEIENTEVLGTLAAAMNPLIWTHSFNTGSNKLTIAPTSESPAADPAGSHWNTRGLYTRGATVYGILEENNEYVVTIKEGLPGATTLPLKEDFVFMFTTTFDPLYASITQIRLHLGNLIEDIPDDTINRIIAANSRFALTLYAPLLIANTGIPWYIPKYVECKTALDIMNSKFLGLGGVGSRKVLADLTIDRANQGRDILALAEKKKEELEICVQSTEALILSGGSAPQPDWAEPFRFDTRGPTRDATWRRLPKMWPRNAPTAPGRLHNRGGISTSRRSRNAGFGRRRNF